MDLGDDLGLGEARADVGVWIPVARGPARFDHMAEAHFGENR
jgi:hypothetical protein